MKFTRLIVLTVALVFAWATAGFAAQDQQCVKRIESFNYLVDQSGSMMMTYQGSDAKKMTKIALAKKAVARVNEAVPDLGYGGGLYLFAPYKTVVPQGAWDRGTLANGLAKISENQEIFGRQTPMGVGLADHDAVIKQMATQAAVIIVSDGESNIGVDPLAEAKAIYAANPGVIFHIISTADSAVGKRTLQNIAALNSGSVMVSAAELVSSDAAVEKFVSDVFSNCGAPVEEVIVLRGVNFAFDSSALDAKACAILDEAAEQIKARGEGVRLNLLGYTDSKGSDAYNARLSQRRANSVKAYLVQAGVPSYAIKATGMGKSFRYDNATEEGRYMNRRCELAFE